MYWPLDQYYLQYLYGVPEVWWSDTTGAASMPSPWLTEARPWLKATAPSKPLGQTENTLSHDLSSGTKYNHQPPANLNIFWQLFLFPAGYFWNWYQNIWARRKREVGVQVDIRYPLYEIHSVSMNNPGIPTNHTVHFCHLPSNPRLTRTQCIPISSLRRYSLCLDQFRNKNICKF